MKIFLSILTILFSINIFATNELASIVQVGNTYTYMYENKAVYSVKYEKPQYQKENPPIIMANCMVHFGNMKSIWDDQARELDFVDVYCGRKKVRFTNENGSHSFSAIKLNSPDNKWAAFLPVSDGYVREFLILYENGGFIRENLGNSSIIVTSNEDLNITGEYARLKGLKRTLNISKLGEFSFTNNEG
jgi:hypothetical protein